MGSKNNPAARGQAGGIKKVKGKTIKPVYYIGKYAGHGNYIAALEDGSGQMVVVNGKPQPFADVIPDAFDAVAAAAEEAAKKKKK